MEDYKLNIINFIDKNQSGIEALLYIAYPKKQRKNWIRRRQIEKFILREIGADTLSEQIAEIESESENYNNLSARGEKLQPLFDFLKDKLNNLSVPENHNVYISKLKIARQKCPRLLSTMLATAGAIVVYGASNNPTHNKAQIKLVHTMKKEWLE
ncbi:hypothetical protein [Neisseria sp. S1]|uniref:hypothetical protein n=1 Tax=Neisseria sp. S1 TaxID=3318354 RepID=UPI003A8A641E